MSKLTVVAVIVVMVKVDVADSHVQCSILFHLLPRTFSFKHLSRKYIDLKTYYFSSDAATYPFVI